MNMQENTATLSLGEASLRWTPPCPDLFKAYPPRRTYGLALVKGGDAIGLTRRGEVFWGIVAGHLKLEIGPRRIMPFGDFLRYVYPVVKDERMDAYKHASKLAVSFTKGYLMACFEGDLNLIANIAEGLKNHPYERVGFMSDAVFNDPIDDHEFLREITADVINLECWLQKQARKAA